MRNRQRQVADELLDLLDRERGILLEGRISDLARLAEQKSRLIGLIQATPSAEVMDLVRAKAERNARLLEAAGHGIRNVTRRIASLREGPKPFSTYRADGRRNVVGGTSQSFERRA